MSASLFQRLFRADRLAAEAVACGARLTYDELREETLRAAALLDSLGIQPGDRVAILLADSPEFIASFVAIISIGAIAVPINLALGSEQQQAILKDSGARAAIVENDVAGTLFENSFVDQFPDLIVVRRGDGLPSASDQIRIHDFASPVAAMTEALLDRASDPDADAFILYTSGSTGEPKGAVHTQADIFYTNQTYCRDVLQLRNGDRLFSSSRLPFAYGLGNSFTFPLLNGFTSILCREKPSPEVISRVLAEDRPTIFFGVPVVYRMLLEHHRNVAPLYCESLRLCISAGEALPAQLGEDWQRTFGVEVLDGIGSTEMLHMFMSNYSGDLRYGSSGKLLKGYDAKLLDHEGQPTAAGEVGNLWIRGNSAASRYWQRSEVSADTFVDGWTRTGDLYRCDDAGFWWHMGRSDDCFKPTGQWVSPVEVESVLVRSEFARAAAVVEGRRDGLSYVCAFVVPTDGCDANAVEKELRARCDESLPKFKRPRRYIFVSELPYTATGKVQRYKLRDQLQSSEQQLKA